MKKHYSIRVKNTYWAFETEELATKAHNLVFPGVQSAPLPTFVLDKVPEPTGWHYDTHVTQWYSGMMLYREYSGMANSKQPKAGYATAKEAVKACLANWPKRPELFDAAALPDSIIAKLLEEKSTNQFYCSSKGTLLQDNVKTHVPMWSSAKEHRMTAVSAYIKLQPVFDPELRVQTANDADFGSEPAY